MAGSRPTAVAGLFYPADATTLRNDVAALLAAATSRLPSAPRALIVPHAGYVYSGPIAASAYAALRPFGGHFERVLLIGPSHRVAFRGAALPTVDAFHSPLGRVPLDLEAMCRLDAIDGVVRRDDAHAQEHSLEVQLPFLQLALRDFRLVPVAVGHANPELAAAVIDTLWADSTSTLTVISTDLSHFLTDPAARAIDQRTSHAIETLQPDAIGPDQACGRIGVQGMLLVAQRRGLEATTLDLRNSSDTAGDPSRVVGYGAYALNG